jgi:type I site-specific restriction endonuclease
MGRSQVKYNQLHGRGGRGRGSGGRGNNVSTEPTNQRQQQQQQQHVVVVAGDNAWRYRPQESTNDMKKTVEEDLMVSSLETHGAHLATPEAADEWAELSMSANVDLSRMGQLLTKLSLAQRLQIPYYLTGEEESPEENVIPKKETATASQHLDNIDTRSSEAVLSEGLHEELDGDLDAWLDSVIS